MGSFSSKLTIPTIKLVKSLPTFQEYPGCTLNQIFEAYGYWVNSEFSRKGTLFPNEFEEVFGQLFPDPIIHFEKLQDKSMGCCVTMDIFYLLIILSDASMEDKIKSIYEMNNKDAKILMRLDAIQAMLYKILSSLKLVFYLDIPSKDEIYNFLEFSFKQFVERTHFNDNEPITVNNNNRRDSSANPQPAAMNTIITTQNTSLTFKEIWQWGQDVYQVSSFLEAINEICLTITDSIDRTHKGKQWVLRNSFFSSHSFKLNTNVNIRNSLRFNSFSPKAASNDLLFNILQEVTSKFNAMENNFFTNYSYQKRHPLWNYTINNLVDHDRWFNTIPVCYTDQKVFTGLEHMILSRQKSLLILHRNFDLVRGGGGGPSSANGGNRFNNSSNTSLIPPLSLGSATSNNNNNNSNSNPNSMRRQSSSHQFLPHPPSSATGGNRPSTHNLHGHRLSAIGSSFSNGLTGKIELFGVLDYGSILAYMIDSAPSIVFREIKKQERLNRSKRLSFEFSLHRNNSEDGGFDSMDGEESEDYGGDSLSRKPSSINRAGSLDLTIDTENLENGSDNEMTSDNENNPSNNNNNNNNNALFLSNIIEEGDDEDDEDNLSTVSNFKNSVAAAVANFSTNNGRGSLRSSKIAGTRQSGLNVSTVAGGGGASSGDDKKTPRNSMSTITSKPSTANTNANNANNNNKPQQQQRRRSMKINTSVSLQTNKWHVMGDLVANSNLEKVFYTKSFASFHAKYDVSNCLTTDQFLYNLILLYAKGIRHFPITLEGNNFYKIFHILSSHEIASFLYENYFDIFMNLHQPQPNKIMTADNDHGGFPDSPKNKKVRSSSQPQGQGSPSPGQSPEKPPAHKQKDHSLVDRPIIWSGLMRNPSFVCSISAPSTMKNNNPSPLKSSRPNSPRDQQQANNNNNNNQNSASSLNPQPSSNKTTTLEANKAKIRYNLGSIFHQLLASNYDSILITNEKNKVISVVSIHLIEEFWCAWKKRSTVTSPLHLTSPLHGQQPPSSLQMEDVIKEYELGTYQLFDEEPPQVASSNPIGGGNQSSSNNNNKPGSAFTAAVSAVIGGGHRLSGNSNATLGVSGNPMPPNNKTPGSSFIQQHRGSQQPGTGAGLTPSSVTGPPSKFSFSNPSASSADLGTPYPFQQNQMNLNSALNTNGTANTANSNNNPSGQNFTFFSILVNYLDQLKDLLNIPILDYDEHLKSPEEIEQERLEREKAKLNSRQKSSPTKGRTATPKTPKNKSAAAAAAPAPGATGVEESKNIEGKDVPAPVAQAQPSRDSPLTLPVPTTPAKPAVAAAAGEGSPKAKVNKGKKGKGGKVVKKWGNFTSYAAFQQHLQREKEKEESKKKADRTRRLEDWFRQLKVLAPHDTLQAALYVMSVTQCNCAHVVSMTGEPLGMVTLQDICKYLVLQEAKQKITMSEFMAHHAHHAHFSQSPVSHLQSSHGVNNNFPIFSNGNDHSPTREILQSKKI